MCHCDVINNYFNISIQFSLYSNLFKRRGNARNGYKVCAYIILIVDNVRTYNSGYKSYSLLSIL